MEMQQTPSVLLPGLYLDDVRKPLAVGESAPDFSLRRYRVAPLKFGESEPQLSLSQWRKTSRGNGTILVFWAFWCDTWKDVTRDLNLLRAPLADMKLSVAAVAVDASQQPVARRALASGRVFWPVAIDESGAVSKSFGVRRVPTFFILDNGGKIRAVYEGFPGKQTFVRGVAKALKLKAPRVLAAGKGAGK